MKPIRFSTRFASGQRIFLGLVLVTAILGCSLPGIPALAPSQTATPSQSPTPEPTFTPTVTPTPLPIAHVTSGDHAFFNGQYDEALLQYQTAFHDSPDPLIQSAAKWGEARIFFAQEKYADTISTLQSLLTDYPQSAYVGHAYFLQGLSNYRLSNYQAAADAWQNYLTARPGVLDAYAQELRGDALFDAGNYAEAVSAYQSAIQAPSLGDDVNLDLKVASTQAKLGDYASALALYDGIVPRTPSDYVKAQVTYESGLAHQALGQNEEALAKFRVAVENYPLSNYAYLSLVALLDANAEVSDLDRGIVDYFAGQYDVAIERLNMYIEANPSNDGTALYYRALSNRGLSFYDIAVNDLSEFITNYPTHPNWGDAWGEKADIQQYNLGLDGDAAKTFIDFSSAAPNSTLVVDFLMSAARIYERNAQYTEALQIWARVANEYPGSAQASTAVLFMGIINYRNGNTVAALESFSRSFTLAISAEDKARATLWMGKAQQKLGNNEEALNAWRQGQTIDPGGYYSERARDLIVDRAPFASPVSLNSIPNLESERRDADAWMKLTFNLPAETDLNGLGSFAGDERVVRGTELWNLGLYEKARLEFESLRSELEVGGDAIGSYRLANYLLDLGLYRTAIFAARQTLTMAGMTSQTESMMAPPYFGHLRYGMYYADLVLPDAQSNNLDPLFIFSVIRQESLFEGFISSSAGARGLMQVVPATGEQIAFQLGWPNYYTDKDLYRPDVSIAFGTHYLAVNQDLLGGSLYATLAAYNGGPGNAQAWQNLSGNDPDLFLESVRFEETRNYIRSIYEIYVIYRRLYGAAE
ncbi:MAG: tetratricopeptide repeat protein [Chloroflexi bacterium]|nr:tetratricopeptide repeat protein [Chloroflexota bacterium]